MPVTELELWSYTFRRSNLVELAAAAAAAGFACVTTTPSLFVRSGGHAADLHARVADHGVRVTFIDGLCTALPGINLPPGEPTIDDCIAMAHATGAGAINVVHATGVPTPVDELADAFGVACSRARPPRTCGWRSSSFPTPASPTSPPRPRSCAKPVRRTGRCCSTPGTPRGGGDLAALSDDDLALVGGLQLSDRSPDQDAEPYVPRRGRKIPGAGALPLAETVARVHAARPDLPIGVEVLSEEVDELGLEAGSRRLAEAARAMVAEARSVR